MEGIQGKETRKRNREERRREKKWLKSPSQCNVPMWQPSRNKNPSITYLRHDMEKYINISFSLFQSRPSPSSSPKVVGLCILPALVRLFLSLLGHEHRPTPAVQLNSADRIFLNVSIIFSLSHTRRCETVSFERTFFTSHFSYRCSSWRDDWDGLVSKRRILHNRREHVQRTRAAAII